MAVKKDSKTIRKRQGLSDCVDLGNFNAHRQCCKLVTVCP